MKRGRREYSDKVIHFANACEIGRERDMVMEMAFDYKKEYKEFYLPPKKPGMGEVPRMNYIAVRGHGDPNEEEGEYKAAIGLLYAIAFTVKMSYKGSHQMEGYFSYVVPPLEGLWWQNGQEGMDGNEKQCGQEGMDGNEWQCGQEGADGHGLQVQARCSKGIDYAHKENFEWISMIRLPEFVTKEEFLWAIGEATEKKQADFSKVEFFTYDEGLCVQCMHIGSYDDEPATIAAMERYMEENGLAADMSEGRFHHEIYLSDPRRCAPEKQRTVIRHPVKKI